MRLADRTSKRMLKDSPFSQDHTKNNSPFLKGSKGSSNGQSLFGAFNSWLKARGGGQEYGWQMYMKGGLGLDHTKGYKAKYFELVDITDIYNLVGGFDINVFRLDQTLPHMQNLSDAVNRLISKDAGVRKILNSPRPINTGIVIDQVTHDTLPYLQWRKNPGVYPSGKTGPTGESSGASWIWLNTDNTLTTYPKN